MSNESRIKRMFARRQFTEQERMEMKELYSSAEFLALRIDRIVPEGIEKELAILGLKDVLAKCEAAVAMKPMPEQAMGESKAYIGGSSEDPMQLQARLASLEKRNADLQRKLGERTG